MPRGVRRLSERHRRQSVWIRRVSIAQQGKVVIQELAYQDVQPFTVFCHEIFDIIVEAGVFLCANGISRERMLFTHRYIDGICFAHNLTFAQWRHAFASTLIIGKAGIQEPFQEDWRLYDLICRYVGDAKDSGDFIAIYE